jgi:hypothetical protein
VTRDITSIRSNTYNQANNEYDKITPKHKNKPRKKILCVARVWAGIKLRRAGHVGLWLRA